MVNFVAQGQASFHELWSYQHNIEKIIIAIFVFIYLFIYLFIYYYYYYYLFLKSFLN